MAPEPRLILLWLAAYLAAGTFYVLRGLGETRAPVIKGEVGGLSLVALCWLPITLGNLVSLHRTRTLPTVLLRFGLETAPPLALLLAIVGGAHSLQLL